MLSGKRSRSWLREEMQTTKREQQMMCDRRKLSVAAFIGLERRVASSGGEYIKAA
jgi:hypothetical protein